MLAADRIAQAIAALDPQHRAMLELSARRGMGEDEIAEMLQVEPAVVGRRREEALGSLAARLDLPEEKRGELERELGNLSEEQWRGAPAEELPGKPRRGRRLVALVSLLVVAGAVAAAVLALSGSDGDDDDAAKPERAERTAPRSEPAPAPAPEPEPAPKPQPRSGPEVAMQRLNGTNGRGTAQIVRTGETARLRLEVESFLTPNRGGYAVWLYTPGAGSRRLFATTDTAFAREFPLPKGFSRFRFAEVARAVPSLNSDHSGLTLLRVPLARLR